MLNRLPNELVRKILGYLETHQFVLTNTICKDINQLKLNLLMIPYYIEAVYSPKTDIKLERRIRFHKNHFGKIAKASWIGLIIDYIESINMMQGDYVYINDSLNRHLNYKFYNNYWSLNPYKTISNFDKLNKINFNNRSHFFNSLNLRALIY